MRLAIDLHMHSCLSPCGDEEMTPNNIANMASLKGLDIIALTDHNAAGNLPAVEQVCAEVGVVLIPGMELTTQEEVHLLAYFHTVDDALNFEAFIAPFFSGIPNNPRMFGRQIIMDDRDEIVREEPRLLIAALNRTLDELVADIRTHNGIPVPAHINRGENGLLINLGFMPPGLNFTALEMTRNLPLPKLDKHSDKLHSIHSSDAHRLADMLEREVYIDLPKRSREAVLDWLATLPDE